MAFRESLNQHSAVATLLAIVLLVVAIGFGMWITGGLRPSAKVASGQWLYDMDTGKFFVGELGKVPPVVAPSGGEGVRAHVYTCQASCPPDDLNGLTPAEIEKLGLFLGYLERVKPEGHEQLEQIRQADVSDATRVMQMDAAILRHGQVRLLAGPDSGWIDRVPETLTLINEHKQAQCPENRPKPCWPGLR